MCAHNHKQRQIKFPFFQMPKKKNTKNKWLNEEKMPKCQCNRDVRTHTHNTCARPDSSQVYIVDRHRRSHWFALRISNYVLCFATSRTFVLGEMDLILILCKFFNLCFFNLFTFSSFVFHPITELIPNHLFIWIITFITTHSNWTNPSANIRKCWLKVEAVVSYTKILYSKC